MIRSRYLAARSTARECRRESWRYRLWAVTYAIRHDIVVGPDLLWSF